MPPPRRVAIIQARTSSSRFPGKVLASLNGVPMIVFMARRVVRAGQVDRLLVATSNDPSDDALAQTLAGHGIDCFRGHLDDVLDRFYQAARWAGADHVVRLTGDCPLMDADLIDRGLRELARGHADYVANILPPSYPDGLDVECMTMHALETAWAQARKPSEREHVTPFIREGRAGLRAQGWRSGLDTSALRWTVDHPDDLAHVSALVEACLRGGADAITFDRFDVLRVIEHQNVGAQAQHQRNEGYVKSLAAESCPALPADLVKDIL